MGEPKYNDGGDPGPTWLNAEARMVFDGASVLLVEDDPDIRELMTTLLQLAGLSPTACSTAEAALEQLREQQFDMVLTDYMLPHFSGGWLLRQASGEGLLDSTAVLVLTAHPNPSDVAGFEIVQKPFDLDDLVAKVRQRLEGGTTKRPRLPLTAPISTGSGSSAGGRKTAPVELILYVSAHSPRTSTAIKSIKQAVGRFAPDRVSLTICDLSEHPGEGAKDGIAFTPTLVKRTPAPRTFILGHITNPDIVTELLESCGEEPR